MKEYYPCNIIIDSTSYYCLWFSREDDYDPWSEDGLVTELYKVKSFITSDELKKYAGNKGLPFKDEQADFNIDTAANWLKSKKKVDCKFFLDFWNLIDDIANSLRIHFSGKRKTKHKSHIYDKLFFGCNLPSITPEGCKYIPRWTKKEMRIITDIVKDGIKIIRNFVA